MTRRRLVSKKNLRVHFVECVRRNRTQKRRRLHCQDERGIIYIKRLAKRLAKNIVNERERYVYRFSRVRKGKQIFL